MLNSCNRNRKDVTFFVVNSSRIVKDVNIEVSLDNNVIINENFIYSGVVPDYTTFIKTYKNGIYKIRVNAGGVIKVDTFDLTKDIYVYISYDAVLREKGDTVKGVGLYKTYIKHVQY